MKKRGERLVFSGVLHDIYQWRQRMYDGSYQTFERLERPSVAIIIPVTGNRIVMAIEEQPALKKCLSLVGGIIEKGEYPLSSAKRELLEEAGMRAEKWRLIGEYKYAGKLDYTLYLFAALNCRKVAEQHLDPGERIEIFTATLDKFLARLEETRLDDKVKVDLIKARYEPARRKKLEKILGLKSG